MKVALLLSGQLRNFEDCFDNISCSIINACSPDVYIYSVDEPGRSERAISLFKPVKYHFEETEGSVSWPGGTIPKAGSQRNKNNLHKTNYNNKDLKGLTGSELKVNAWTVPLHTLQMQRKLNACCSLLEGEYDWIIKSRFDCQFLDMHFSNEFLSGLDPEALHIPEGGDHEGTNDTVCVSSHRNMNHYCNLYNNIASYCLDEGVTFHPESLLKHHLKGRLVKRFNCVVTLRGAVHNFKGS